MGYYTKFSLALFDAKTGEPVDDVSDELYRRVEAAFGGGVGYDDKIDWNLQYGYLFDGEAMKWYDHESDVTSASRALPDFILALSGVGENSDDQWTMYAHDGRSYREVMPKWVPPPVNMAKLGALP